MKMAVAVFYWVCLVLGIFLWSLGGIVLNAKLREITEQVYELKTMVRQLRGELKDKPSYLNAGEVPAERQPVRVASLPDPGGPPAGSTRSRDERPDQPQSNNPRWNAISPPPSFTTHGPESHRKTAGKSVRFGQTSAGTRVRPAALLSRP